MQPSLPCPNNNLCTQTHCNTSPLHLPLPHNPHKQYGAQDVQLSAAEQLVDRSQTRAVADAMKWLQARLKQQQPQPQQQGGGGGGGGKTLRQWLLELEAAFDTQVGGSLC